MGGYGAEYKGVEGIQNWVRKKQHALRAGDLSVLVSTNTTNMTFLLKHTCLTDRASAENYSSNSMEICKERQHCVMIKYRTDEKKNKNQRKLKNFIFLNCYNFSSLFNHLK